MLAGGALINLCTSDQLFVLLPLLLLQLSLRMSETVSYAINNRTRDDNNSRIHYHMLLPNGRRTTTTRTTTTTVASQSSGLGEPFCPLNTTCTIEVTDYLGCCTDT